MSSLKYWERRQAQRMFEYMQSAEDTADEISKLYQKASGYISHELDRIFERYKRKHHLTDAEAYGLLNTLRDKTSLDELKKALKASGRGQTAADLLAELESPAYQARLERLQQLQNQIDLVMREVYNQEKARNTSHYVDLANEAYYKGIFDIQQRTGLGFSFSLVDPKVIDSVINSKWSGANYSDRIWNNTVSLARSLKQELLVSLVTGRTNRETADIIANKYAQGASMARRLVRTESCNLVNQMEMQAYEECGIETYIYVATLDLRTSAVCQGLDGKRFPVAEQQPGKNCPPMHPWCRSTTICNISAEELAKMQRRARDPVTGKNALVPAGMTYEEWYRKNVEGRAQVEYKEMAVKNHSADRKQYEKYKTALGEDVPKSLDSFQKMKYTDKKKWSALRHEYRIVNQYDTVSGSVPPKKIVELHEKNQRFRNDFRAGIGKKGNAATLEFNGRTYYSNSSIQSTTSRGYSKYKGNPADLILLKSKEERIFKIFPVKSESSPYGSWDRCIDSEAKLMEFLHDSNDERTTMAYLLSDFPMCDSCKNVLEQFKQHDSNIHLNVVERKRHGGN